MTASAASRQRYLAGQAGRHAHALRWQVGTRYVAAIGCRVCGHVGPSPASTARAALDAWAQHVAAEHAHLVDTVAYSADDPDPISVIDLTPTDRVERAGVPLTATA